MCDNQECKCFKFEVGKTYQSVGDPKYKVKILYVGSLSAFAKVVSCRREGAFHIGQEQAIPSNSGSSLYWREYKEPKVETHSLFVKKYNKNVWADNGLQNKGIIGRIVVTVTDDKLTSVEIVK